LVYYLITILFNEAKNITKKRRLRSRFDSDELLKTLNVTYPVLELLLLKDGYLAVADSSPVISIWNFRSKIKLKQLPGHTSQVWALALLDKNTELTASGSQDSTIKLWNFTSGLLLKNLTDHKGPVFDLVSSSDDDGHLFSCSADEMVKMWNILNGIVLKTFKHSKKVLSVCLFQKYHLVSGSFGGGETVLLWNISSGEKTQLANGYNGVANCLCILSNGHLAYADKYFIIRILNLTTSFLISSLIGHTEDVSFLINLNKDYLGSSSKDRTIKIWNWKSGQCVAILKSHLDSIFSLVLWKNHRLLSGSLDRSVKSWDIMSVLRNFNISLKYGSSFIYSAFTAIE
jgi:WD40 repeat protein